jgi:hypothetical protein
VTQLCARIKHLHLWAVSPGAIDIPSQLEHTVLTKPLRYSPAVLRHLKPWLSRVISDITTIPVAREGADVITLHHHGDGHRGFWPLDCKRCGQNVGVKLRQIGVGSAGGLDFVVVVVCFDESYDL